MDSTEREIRAAKARKDEAKGPPTTEGKLGKENNDDHKEADETKEGRKKKGRQRNASEKEEETKREPEKERG